MWGTGGLASRTVERGAVAHALSSFSSRFDRMSPSALALAVLLHVLVILALWWISLNRPAPPVEEAIEVTFEQPKPEPPPPPPPEPARKPPPPAPPINLGLRPPAPLTSDKPTQVPPAGERPDEPPAPPPPPVREALPSPELQPTPPTLIEPAKPTPSVPPLQAPGPQQKQALVAPPPAKPPLPQPHRPVLEPSPLTTAPPQRPPAGRPTENASRSPFVNPADSYNRARAADNYLWQVVRRLAGYRYQANVSAMQGITVVRVVIARDGRLLDVDIAQSSGYPEFDRGVLAGVRAGSPYDPLPADIHGDSATFSLPLVSVRRQ